MLCLRKRVKTLPLLRQVGKRRGHPCLKLRYGFGVIAPANLTFASGENERLFGSETPVLRRLPYLLSEFFAWKQQTPFGSGFCHRFPPIWTVEVSRNVGRRCGGTFVPRFGQKSPHPFLLKKKNLAVETRAASPQPFMFQYVCRSPIIRLNFMHAAPAAVEKCRNQPTLADVRSTPASVGQSLPPSACIMP